MPASHENHSQLKGCSLACSLASKRAHLELIPHSHPKLFYSTSLQAQALGLNPRPTLMRKFQRAAFSGGEGRESAPKFSQVVTRIQFLKVVGLCSCFFAGCQPRLLLAPRSLSASSTWPLYLRGSNSISKIRFIRSNLLILRMSPTALFCCRGLMQSHEAQLDNPR